MKMARSELRNVTIANDRAMGWSYSKIAKKHDLSKMQIGRILKKIEIKEIVDQSTANMIAQLPLADQVYYERLVDTEKPELQLKAAQDIRKATGLTPSNVTNQTIHQVYNIQNNVTLNPGVAKALSGLSMQDDPDAIDVDEE